MQKQQGFENWPAMGRLQSQGRNSGEPSSDAAALPDEKRNRRLFGVQLIKYRQTK
jgi:hypothetical protein